MPDLQKAAAALRKAATSTARRSKTPTYKGERLDFLDGLAAAAQAFLDGDNRNSTFRTATGLMLNAYTLAAIKGFQEGAEDKSAALGPEDELYLRTEQAAEAGYLGGLWADLAERRAKGDRTLPLERLEQYANSLDALYNAMKLRGARSKPLKFVGDDGTESCGTCRRLKGKTHPASWWIERDLIPGAANEAYDCRGWRCQHYLEDRSGKRFTL